MLWLPQQTPADWRATVEGLIALEPDHASLYILELYPNAPLREEMARAHWSLAPDDDAADMYLWGLERLEAAGYDQYEISNVARPGAQSRHNLKYWQDGAWLGFGCGAHSTRGACALEERRVDDATTSRGSRQARACTSSGVQRPVDEQIGDALFTGLRLTGGLDFDQVGQRYGVDLWDRYRRGARNRWPPPGVSRSRATRCGSRATACSWPTTSCRCSCRVEGYGRVFASLRRMCR